MGLAFNKWCKYYVGWSLLLSMLIGAIHPPFWAFVGIVITWAWFGWWWIEFNTKWDALEKPKDDPPVDDDKMAT